MRTIAYASKCLYTGPAPDAYHIAMGVEHLADVMYESCMGGVEMHLRTMSHTRGQGLVEYALIIALVAVVVIGTLILLGPQIRDIFQNISNNL